MRALKVFVVLGSSLLFMMQPLVGRILLPTHGGSFQVWTTCMLFFQLALLVGYLYAHLWLPRLGHWHRAVLILSLPCATLALARVPARAGSIADILLALSACVLLPFVVLATTSILAQRRVLSGDPYALYAYSNLGSLIGLLSYPFLLEPWLGIATQRVLWAVLYAVYVALAWRFTLPPMAAGAAAGATEPLQPLAAGRIGYWLMLSASACGILLGLTNVFSLGAGSIPLVWVMTLAAYLLGFVAGFSSRGTSRFDPSSLLPEVLLMQLLIYVEPGALNTVAETWLVPAQLLCLFWLTWCACAELHRTRPQSERLSAFYLVIACGGALGGLLVSLLAPIVLRTLYEFPIALLTLAVTVMCGRASDIKRWLLERSSWAAGRRLHPVRVGRVALLIAGLALCGRQVAYERVPTFALRNFYGIYDVWDYDRGRDDDGVVRSVRILSHNGTNHGFQSRRTEERCMPTGYYHRHTPLGDLLPATVVPRHAAVIGLGAGAISSYFSAQDELTFYELDADTVSLAHDYFTYLDGCSAKPRIVLGDARIELGRDAQLRDHSLDVLVVDAFSGDSVPCHLLTREAQALYLRKLAPGGLLIFHTSSRFFELWPAIASTASTLGMHSAVRSRTESRALGPLAWASQYLAVSPDASVIDGLAKRGWILSTQTHAQIWTDDRVSLLWPMIQRFAKH